MKEEFNEKVNSEEIGTKVRKYDPKRNGHKSKSRSKGNRSNKSRNNNNNRARLANDVKSSNDPNWYFTDPQLMESVSKFSFNNFLGYGSGPGYENIPYAVTFTFNPAAGNPTPKQKLADLRNNGINIAALKLYTTLSSQSGKTTNYGPEDISILMLALGSLIETVEFGRRALGLAFTYNNRNWNYPSNIIHASGFDASILDNLAQKRMDFNVAINSINKIVFPSNIAYFAKCAQMYQNVWLDSESPMAQSIIFAPASAWILNEEGTEAGSVLNTENWLPYSTWDQYMDLLKRQINAILMSSTYNYIYGDVLNYASKRSIELFHLDLVSEAYGVIPMYNANVLSQIHNLQTTGGPAEEVLYLTSSTETAYSTPSNDVHADAETGCIVYNPAFTYVYGCEDSLYVDSIVAEPDVNVRVDMTRYAVRCSGSETLYTKGSQTGMSYMKGVTLPDHYCVAYYIACRATDGSFTREAKYTFADVYTNSVDNLRAATLGLAQIAAFDWFPILYITNGSNHKITGVFGDLNFYTELDIDYLRPVNTLCYEGLFDLR